VKTVSFEVHLNFIYINLTLTKQMFRVQYKLSSAIITHPSCKKRNK